MQLTFLEIELSGISEPDGSIHRAGWTAAQTLASMEDGNDGNDDDDGNEEYIWQSGRFDLLTDMKSED